MIHLRLIVPASLSTTIVDHLEASSAVAHLAVLRDAARSPRGDVVLCDVAREGANDVIEWLQANHVHRQGAISIGAIDAVVSDAAAVSEAATPGEGADALVWEAVESRAREDAGFSASFLLFMGIASVIAGVGILLDSPILIVGAMVVGPEYGPLSAICVALARRRGRATASAAVTLGAGLLVAAAVALVATAAFRVVGIAPDRYALGERELTAFISHPDAMAAVVAVVAGIAGMLSVTQARSGSLVGVLVSVTTIPAVANIGVATAYGAWGEVRGGAVQLAVNVAGLVLAGVVTLLVQARTTTRLAPTG